MLFLPGLIQLLQKPDAGDTKRLQNDIRGHVVPSKLLAFDSITLRRGSGFGWKRGATRRTNAAIMRNVSRVFVPEDL